MANIQKYVAPGVYDPPGYSQAVKVTGAQTILYLAGQVAYDKDGGVAHKGDFKGQARAVFSAIKALVEAGGGKSGLQTVSAETKRVVDDYAAVWDAKLPVTEGPAAKNKREGVEIIYKRFDDPLATELIHTFSTEHPGWRVTSKYWDEAPADVVIAVGPIQ